MAVTTNTFNKYINHLKCNLISFDVLSYDNDWQSIMHTHPYCEILIITNGEGLFLGENLKLKIQKNQAIFINPFTYHTEISKMPDKPSSTFQYVSIALENISFFSKSKDNNAISIIDCSTIWPNIKSQLTFLEHEIEKKNTYWETIAANTIESIIISIMRISKLNDFPSKQATPIKKIDSLIETSKRYLEENYPFDFSVDKLSDFLCINKFYLMHRFKASTGKSLMQYLTKIRIEKAKQMLKTTDFSVTEIAIQIGFSSCTLLCKTFKKYVGISPLQYKTIK